MQIYKVEDFLKHFNGNEEQVAISAYPIILNSIGFV